MKKIAATLSVAVLLVLVAQQPVASQGAPAGKTLHARADQLRQAFLTGTQDGLFSQLAPWMQGRAKLFDERFEDIIEDQVQEFPEEVREQVREDLHNAVLEMAKVYDPAGKLGIKTFEDILALSPAQMVALETNQLRVQGTDELSERRSANWYETERLIYTEDEEDDDGVGRERTFGSVVFMNKHLDKFSVLCVADGDTWQVVEFEGSIGDQEFSSEESDFLQDPADEFDPEDLREEARVEGEQLMGSGRDYSRVQFAKTGLAPVKFTNSMTEGEFADSFAGEHFKLRDTIYEKPDMARAAIVAEPVEDQSLGWGALYFDWASGKSDIKWYDAKEDLEQALKNFQTAK